MAEVDEGVAAAARHGDAGVQVAAAGPLPAEAFLEPGDGAVQVRGEVSDVLNLVKHDALSTSLGYCSLHWPLR